MRIVLSERQRASVKGSFMVSSSSSHASRGVHMSSGIQQHLNVVPWRVLACRHDVHVLLHVK